MSRPIRRRRVTAASPTPEKLATFLRHLEDRFYTAGVPLTWRGARPEVLAFATTLAVSLWLSALDVLYRDVQYAIPFLVQLWMFVSPVIYPVSDIPAGPLRIAFALNPMTGVIGGFRWALLGQQFPGGYVWISLAIVGLLFVTGLFYFKRIERVFADVV